MMISEHDNANGYPWTDPKSPYPHLRDYVARAHRMILGYNSCPPCRVYLHLTNPGRPERLRPSFDLIDPNTPLSTLYLMSPITSGMIVVNEES